MIFSILQGKDKTTFEDRVQKLLVEMFGEENVSYQPKLKYITITIDNEKAVVNLKSYEGMFLNYLFLNKSFYLLSKKLIDDNQFMFDLCVALLMIHQSED